MCTERHKIFYREMMPDEWQDMNLKKPHSEKTCVFFTCFHLHGLWNPDVGTDLEKCSEKNTKISTKNLEKP